MSTTIDNQGLGQQGVSLEVLAGKPEVLVGPPNLDYHHREAIQAASAVRIASVLQGSEEEVEIILSEGIDLTIID
ncbi:MAG: hypothetical protein O3A81_04735 [bacterium]|nr:hypothetical protein [bacterium]